MGTGPGSGLPSSSRQLPPHTCLQPGTSITRGNQGCSSLHPDSPPPVPGGKTLPLPSSFFYGCFPHCGAQAGLSLLHTDQSRGMCWGELQGHPHSSQLWELVGTGSSLQGNPTPSTGFPFFSALGCESEDESTTLCWPLHHLLGGKTPNTSKNSLQSLHPLVLARRGEINIPPRSVTLCRVIKRELHPRQCGEKEKKN